MEYISDDERREIFNRLDDDSLVSIGSTGKRWRGYRAWCTDSFINNIKTKGVSRREIDELYPSGNTQRPIFIIVLETTGNSNVSLSMKILDRQRGKRYVINLDMLSGRGYATVHSFNLGPFRSDREGAVVRLFDSSEPSSPTSKVLYWLDPFTTRDVIRRRIALSKCDVEEPTLHQLFPVLDNKEIEVTMLQYYTLGCAICMRYPDINIDRWNSLSMRSLSEILGELQIPERLMDDPEFK